MNNDDLAAALSDFEPDIVEDEEITEINELFNRINSKIKSKQRSPEEEDAIDRSFREIDDYLNKSSQY